jgi:acetyltransferase-like isoleucine patch superfamily enzyme
MYQNIKTDNLTLGKNTFVHPTAIIRGISGNAKNIYLGDNCYIGENVQIICDDFTLGDYCKIHHHTNIHGYKPCKIGHNAWVGQYTIIDSIGGTTIGNNCGIGAHSQLWSHIKFGDTLEGCNFLSEKELLVGNDVWFVGHCIVSPIVAADKSMAMVGSVITKDMKFNEIYAGSPAKSISDKVGFQFNEIPVETKFEKLNKYLEEFQKQTEVTSNIKIVKTMEEVNYNDDITYFDVSSRRYTKRSTEIEIAFMSFLLPAKAKFIPFH